MAHEWLAENQGNSTSWLQATPGPTAASGTAVYFMHGNRDVLVPAKAE